METNFAKKTIDDIKIHKIAKKLSFHVMGKPLLHPDFLEIVEYAKNKGFKIFLNTNGSLLDDDISKKLLELRVEEIRISLQTPEKYYYESLRITPIGWNEYIKKIKEFLKIFINGNYDTKIYIEIGITKNNFITDLLNYKKTPFRIINTSKEFEKILKQWSDFVKETYGKSILAKNKIKIKNGEEYKIHPNIYLRMGYIFPWVSMFKKKYRSYWESAFHQVTISPFCLTVM